MPNKEIIIEAFVVDPTKGSEAGMAWQHIIALSEHYKLHIVTQSFEGNDERIDAYLKQNSLPNLSFYFIPLSKISWLHRFPINYLLYNFWHLKSAYFIWRKFKNSGIKIIHKLNTVGYRIPGFCYLLPYKFVWGPIDGFTNVDSRLLVFLNRKGRFAYRLYNFINFLERNLSPLVQVALYKSAVILAATQDSFQYLNKVCKNKKIVYVLETGVSDSIVSTHLPKINCEKRNELVISWVGQIIYRKNLPFLLNALANLPSSVLYKLHIIGDGALRKECQSLAVQLGIEPFIEWHGWIDRKKAIDILANSSVFVQISIREVNSVVLFEALANCVPIIAIATSGMKDIVNEGIGHLIGISDKQKMTMELRDTIIEYYQNPPLLAQKRVNILDLAKSKYHITTQTNRIVEMYEAIN